MADSSVREVEISIVLSKQVDKILYRMMPKTRASLVYDENDRTLSEIIFDMNKLITAKADDVEFQKVKNTMQAFFADTPEDFQTLLDVRNYINASNDKIEAINRVLGNKVDVNTYNEDSAKIMTSISDMKESLRVLSTDTSADFDTIKARLEAIEKSMEKMNKNILASSDDTCPEELIDQGFWVQIVEQ